MSKSKYNNASHENRIHSSTLIPYTYYRNIMPDYFSSVPMHRHEEFELSYIREGIGDFICEDAQFRGYKGDILLIPCNHLHSIHPFEEYRLVFDTVVFDVSMLGTSLHDRGTKDIILPFINGENQIFHIPTTFEHYDAIASSITSIIKSCKKNNAINDVIIKSELLKLIATLSKHCSLAVSNGSNISYSDLVRPGIEYINENYMHEITVEKLSEVSHLSKSYFMGCFKKAVGYSSIDFLSQVRIKNACDLLITSDKSISDIAYMCGYNNLSNFNRQFKSLSHMTPKEYRLFRTKQE